MQLKTFSRFKHTIENFYKKNKRDLPWRNTINPYHILVSEIMLQQTQVSRVLVKYPEFLQAFPDLENLASASLPKLLGVWQGMGYNRRALYLQKTARLIRKNFNGEIPKDPLVLKTFPGIGENTAGSVVVFSHNIPFVFIETNIRRVFIHHFFSNKDTVHDKQIIPLIQQTLDQKNPREWYYALMDYGSHLAKTIQNPNRKSTHYVIQSKLQGSVREVRGKILKILLTEGSLPILELEKKVSLGKIKFKKAFNDLISEGFIEVKNNIVVVKKHE